MRTLYGLAMSPWTERARWALEHHRVGYRYHEHVPLLGEALLRRAARGGTGPATVPLLVDGDAVLRTSTDIARHAERIGRGAPLFGRAAAGLERWEALSQRVLGAGRVCMLAKLAKSRSGQREALPWLVPGPLRGVLAPSAALGAAFIRRKHGVSEDVRSAVEDTIRPALAEVRAALGGRPYLLDAFSWADVAVATALAVVRPPAAAKLGPATRELWTDEALAREFDDLLMWRDAVVGRHR